MTAARGVRNRNPGNIIVSGWTQRQDGYLGPEPEGRFARFDTMAHGVRALLRLLLVYRDSHKLKTVRQIINRWAPSSENDTGSYVLSVAKAIGVGIDDELPADAETYIRLARAIVAHENGRDQAVAVTDEDYAEAASTIPFSQPAGNLPQAPSVSSPAPAPAAPIKDKIMALPALVTAAASALLPIIADLFRARGSATSTRNAQIVDAVGDAAPAIVAIAKEVAGGNEQQAAEAILADPELQKQFRAQVALKWSDIEPFLRFEEESRGKAREFMLAATSTGPEWRQIGVGALLAGLSLIITVGGGWILWWLLAESNTAAEQRGMIIGAIVTILTSVVGYWFGSSASSRSSGQALQDIAKR